MVKYIKFGRFAVAYDDARPAQRVNPDDLSSPPTAEPSERKLFAIYVAKTIGIAVAAVFGFIVLLFVIASIKGETGKNPAASTGIADDRQATITQDGDIDFSQFLGFAEKESWFQLDELPTSAARVCNGEYIWYFNWNDPNTFSLGGDVRTVGSYRFDGRVLHLFNQRQTAGLAGEETSTPLPDIWHDVRKLPNGRVKIGRLSYRDCAATGAGGNDEADTESPGGNDTAFAEHEATPLDGRFKMPSFAGDPDHANYKTRLVDAAKNGVNFGGHFAFTQIGCGTQCNFAMAVDGNTGQVLDFPIGGEDYLEMSLMFRPDSSLVKAYWNPDEKDQPTCEYADFVQEGSSFRRLPNDGARVLCP